MGYISKGKKLLVAGSLVLLSGIYGSVVAKEFEGSPTDRVYLLSPKSTFEYLCSPCHGLKGKGDGTFFTYGLEPTPRNLTEVEYMSKKTDADLAKSITGGSQSVGLSNLCPPWGNTLDEKKIGDLVIFIRGLAEQEETDSIAEAKGEVAEERKSGAAKSMMRWIFLAVITFALAGGAIGEWKKLKNESK
ncbi:MAG: hypothetical protein MRJ65_10415 [Candidatus Brocadiaceae bacterium]|nr:hypothetical protein [Candidatus Brocadiaceae bacterium]